MEKAAVDTVNLSSTTPPPATSPITTTTTTTTTKPPYITTPPPSATTTATTHPHPRHPPPNTPNPPSPYSTLPPRHRLTLHLLLGLATAASPLTATTYLPLLPLLQHAFHTTPQAINLTLTVYIVCQAVSPAVFGPLSDGVGRRVVYLGTVGVYVGANVGLAVLGWGVEEGGGGWGAGAGAYAALVVLRGVQSLGASAAFAVSYGVVADVCGAGERGRVVGPLGMALNLGACVGPVVGGWVAYGSGGFAWVFWTLVGWGVGVWAAIGLWLPETLGAREREGVDGWWEGGWWSVGRRWVRRWWCGDGEEQGGGGGGGGRDRRPDETTSFLKRCRVANPLACLRIIFHRDTFLALWMHGSFYTVDYTLVAAVPAIFKDVYSFNELQTGLAYLPRGTGIIIGSYCNGRLMDLNFRVTAHKTGWTPDPTSRYSIDDFPIEKARSRGSLGLLLVSTATLVGYGWAVSSHVHVSVPLILQFIQGFWGTCFYTTYNTLLVDLYPKSPSTAAATASMVRCAMAATGVAVLQPLLDAAGLGWYFTCLGIWSGACGAAAVLLIRKKGMVWRTQRLARVHHLAA
ncbi:mfs general substrate transporter [Diplodia corticola]|uniref:Mfs general substrate transporter n=1 Tax=Diplodia corticola TaxID=236234 RepID=A0A1J9RX58_9PEZI|nr:mfs general substrate transporter [Diplodia corticola]OJD32069.1 mfs general substrate transporter [Diplodia corticola]